MEIVLPLRVIRIEGSNEFLASGYRFRLSTNEKMSVGALVVVNLAVFKVHFHLGGRSRLPVCINRSNRFFNGGAFQRFGSYRPRKPRPE